MVGLNADASFPRLGIIKFNRIVTNIGNGYIGNNSDPNYSKFIAPVNGSYMFSANFYHNSGQVGGDLRVNGTFIISSKNGAEGTASLSAVVALEQGDEVWLENPSWVSVIRPYNKYFTSFSGGLLHADA